MSVPSSRVIFGCHGLELTPAEIQLFKQVKPWGFILFSRNIESPTQLSQLVASMKNTVERNDVPILIDQEGGRVSRLPETFWRLPPSPTLFAKMYLQEPKNALRAMYLNYRLIGHDLKTLGINVNCAPMVDVAKPNASPIVTERAYGDNAESVIALAHQVVEGLKHAGVAPVVKHVPGHGRATSDSHHVLPRVSATAEELRASDFQPFQAFNQESMFMSAHIVYEDIDANAAATLSPKVINEVIRGDMGFQGLLMSDDVNMKALSGSIQDRVTGALEAGCDIALHCNGEFEEMQEIAEIIPRLEGIHQQRAEHAEAAAFASAKSFDKQQALNELESLLVQ